MVDPKGLGGEAAEPLLKLGDLNVPCSMQISEGDVRSEAAFFRGKAGAPRRTFAALGELGQNRRGLDADPNRIGFAPAKAAGAFEPHFEGRLLDQAEFVIEIAR